MELLQNLWNVLSTEDENLMRYILLFLGIIENLVTLKFFTTILNINYSAKQRNIYLALMSALMVFSVLFIPKEISIFVHLVITFLIVKLVFKTSIIKSILAEIIPMLISVILESLYAQMCFILFHKTFLEVQYIIIYRVPVMLMFYLLIFLFSIIIKEIKKHITLFENIDSYKKKLLFINLFFIILLIATQFYLFIFYSNVLPLYITLISLSSILTYAFVTIYSLMKTINLDMTKQNLQQAELHNKTLELLYNNVSAFKHDFSNILTAFGGYIFSKNIDGLENYYNKIVDECHINNNLSTLNPSVVNNPAVYNILATKYYKADDLGININLQIFINLNNLKLDIYEFCRILGIFLDNSIEAAAECEEKVINIEIHDIKPRKYQSLIIENTYLNKNIDINKLSEKGYTSKTENTESHGIGLWQVSKMLKKHKNVLLETSKNDKFFKQELLIFY